MKAMQRNSSNLARRHLCALGLGLLALVAGVAAAADATAPATASLTHGPTVGGVTESRAQLWVRLDGPAPVAFRYGTDPALARFSVSTTAATVAEQDFTARVIIEPLQPDVLYYYAPVVAGKVALQPPYPRFRTAPTVDESAEFTFVYLTDFQNPNSGGRVETFRSAAACDPAFAILGGDFDHRNPGRAKNGPERTLEDIRERTRTMYRENLQRGMSRRTDLVDYILRRGSIAHFWDDHDFCCNGSDGTYHAKHLALRIYDEYFPGFARPAPEEGIYQTWRWGQVQFFLLDGRFHRTPRDAPAADKTLLGAEQKAWLKRELLASTAVWKILLTGSVFNPTVKCGADNWCDYRHEGRELTDFINHHEVRNVVLMSGDLHAGAITDGTNPVYNTFWEMMVPGADVYTPGCDTSTYQGPGKFGVWTHGTWGEGFRKYRRPLTCFGYGQVDVLTGPHRLVLSVKDELGETRITATVHAD
ncbi:MAG: hypothetical protein GY838_10365 [bacterium]|nr:hypothetical protein [bacterium]